MSWGHDKKILKMTLVIVTIMAVAAIFSGCLGGNKEIKKLSIDGSTTVFPIAQAVGEKYMDDHDNVDIQVSGTGSSNGISAVGSGSADIGMASRELKSSEEDLYPNLEQYVVAKDGIALIVHTSNTVSQLTIDQVKGIYNGTYTSWNQLGGSSSEIVVVGRDSASGTREFFWKEVMEKEDFVDTMLEKNSNGAVYSTVSTTPGAIGYVGLGYVDDQIKAIDIQNDEGDYITPSVQNVLDGKYPIFRNLNMFTNGEATGLAKEFLDYITSDAGQEIVSEQGFVPINS